MAVSKGQKSLQVNVETRTWRVEVFCEKGQVPTVVAHRETVTVDEQGGIVSNVRAPQPVTRTLDKVATQEFTVGGKKYTVAEIAAVIAEIADAWDDEDQSASEPEVVHPKPPVG